MDTNLIVENARLHARVRSLEYEVEMLTQLVKNIIYRCPDLSSGDPFEGLMYKSEEVVEFEVGEKRLETLKIYEEEVSEICQVKNANVVSPEDEIPHVENKVELVGEMGRLYGERMAGEILSFETSMQAKFNEKCDAGGGAKLWPCIAMNMKFDN